MYALIHPSSVFGFPASHQASWASKTADTRTLASPRLTDSRVSPRLASLTLGFGGLGLILPISQQPLSPLFLLLLLPPPLLLPLFPRIFR